MSIVSNNLLNSELQVEQRKSKFGISEDLEMSKIIHGLFLDRYQWDCDEERSFNRLRRFEWFGGSLTGHKLAKELSKFLLSTHANALSEDTRKQIETFIHLVHDAQEHANQIDLARSQDLRLGLLAATGNRFWLGSEKSYWGLRPIQELVSGALNRVKSLKEGQKALFLLGSFIHETLLSVELKQNGQYELCYYDSAGDKTIVNYLADKKSVLDVKFWEPLILFKFSGDSRIKLQEHLSQFKKPPSDIRFEHAMIAKQKTNTCHFRCYLAALKDQIVRHSAMDLETAFCQWNILKSALGEFLLENAPRENRELRDAAKRKQEEFSVKADLCSGFLSCIEQGKYQETLETYSEVFKRLGGRMDPSDCGCKLK